MSWRLRISHRTGSTYAGPAGSSYNEARMTPASDGRQTVLDSAVSVVPAARTFTYRDYWQTLVTAFDLHVPHQSLEVVADSLVETSAVATAAVAIAGVDWAAVETDEVTGQWPEVLLPTPRTALDSELTAIAAEIRASCPHPEHAARTVCDLVHDRIAYVPGATGVQTDAVTVWRQGEGVCQDISHLCVGLLRAIGLPARYVSGYLYPSQDAILGAEVNGQSHAWVEWFDGDWHGYDPTNGIGIGERHVLVGRGRDYADVPPLKGVYAGPAATGQSVSVTLTRLR